MVIKQKKLVFNIIGSNTEPRTFEKTLYFSSRQTKAIFLIQDCTAVADITTKARKPDNGPLQFIGND